MNKREKLLRIDQWAVVSSVGKDAYMAPELEPIRLKGFIEGHPTISMARQRKSKGVATSAIVAFEGRIVKCVSRKYRLGRIDPGYRKWLKANRPLWNWRRPLTVISATT